MLQRLGEYNYIYPATNSSTFGDMTATGYKCAHVNLSVSKTERCMPEVGICEIIVTIICQSDLGNSNHIYPVIDSGTFNDMAAIGHVMMRSHVVQVRVIFCYVV